jgi:hypothetical protein
MADDDKTSEPFRITLTGGRYIIYDFTTIAHVQRNHGIDGASKALEQYNPLELTPDDAALLVNKGAAEIVNEPLKSPQNAPKSQDGRPKIATASDNTQDNWNDIPDDMLASRGRANKAKKSRSRLGVSPVPSTAPASRTASANGPPSSVGLRSTASQPMLRPPPPPLRTTTS